MTHTDPDVLAMMAMGEAVSPADSAHLDACPDCAVELASLRHVADLARSGLQEETLATPAPEVWSRISSQLGFEADVRPAPFPMTSTGAAAEPTRGDRPPIRGASAEGGPASDSWVGHHGSPGKPETPGSRETPGSGGSRGTAGSPGSPGGPRGAGLDAARRASGSRRVGPRRWLAPALLAVTAVVLVAGSAVAIVVQQGSAPTVLAEAELDPLPEWAGSTGDARVEEAIGGGRDLVVTTSDGARAGGYREVWLISPDLTGLVSLGVLEGSTGTFAIPAGVDLADYPIVDVSQEPLDGNPAHSGDSILRGTVG